MPTDAEHKRWQGTDYRTSVKDDGSWRVERREKGGDWKPVPGAKGKVGSKVEAEYLAQHRKQIVREGDSIH